MVTFPILDLVLESDEKLECSLAVTTQFIESSLADIDQIERIDVMLIPDSNAALDRKTAALVRGMYENWAREAEALLERVEQLQSRCGAIPKYEALRDAHGRTRAMLSVSLEDMEQGRRDVIEGRLISAEEIRRELRLGVR